MKSFLKFFSLIVFCLFFSNIKAQWNQVTFNDHMVMEMKSFNNKLFIGGSFITMDGNSCRMFSVYNDSIFNCNLTSVAGNGIRQMTVFNDTLYAVGLMNGPGLNMGVAFWNGITWQTDTAFHIPYNGLNFNFATAIFADGNDLYVGDYLGYVHKKTGNGPYSLLSTKPLDGWQSINSIIKFDGKIIVGGSFMGWDNTSYIWRIAQWDGSSWLPLNRGLSDAVHSMAVYNNELYVGGSFTAAFNGVNGINTNGLVKWNGSIWTDVTAGNIAGGDVNDLLIYNNELYAAGTFPATIVKYNGINWTGLGFSNLPYAASKIEAYNNCIYMATYPILCNPPDMDKIIYKYCLPLGQNEEMSNGINDINIFPNPVIDVVNILFKVNGNKVFTLYNSHGQIIKIFYENHSDSEGNSQFDLTELPPGIYFLKANGDDTQFVKKIIKL